MKTCLGFTLSVILVLSVLVGCAQPAPASKQTQPAAPTPPAAGVIELKFSHHNPPVARTTTAYLTPWAKKIEEATKGRVKMTIYPAESLHKSNQGIEAIKGGLTDITWNTNSYFLNDLPLSNITNLPFLGFPNAEKSSGIFWDLYQQSPELQKEYAPYKVLMLHTSDPYFLISIKKQVTTLSDMVGMKMRAMPGGDTELWKQVGAAPIFLSIPEWYEGAQKGIIEATGAQWAAIATWKLYEVFKYYTVMPILISSFSMIMNLDKWNSIPKDVQEQIMSVCGKAGGTWAGKVGWDDAKDEVMAKVKSSGYTFDEVKLAPGELEKFKAAAKPSWQTWIKDQEAKGKPAQKVFDQLMPILDKNR